MDWIAFYSSEQRIAFCQQREYLGTTLVFHSPTVHFLRDPHSNVYTFDPRLESIPTAEEFAFDRLPPYITASRDEVSDMRFAGTSFPLTPSHLFAGSIEYRGEARPYLLWFYIYSDRRAEPDLLPDQWRPWRRRF